MPKETWNWVRSVGFHFLDNGLSRNSDPNVRGLSFNSSDDLVGLRQPSSRHQRRSSPSRRGCPGTHRTLMPQGTRRQREAQHQLQQQLSSAEATATGAGGQLPDGH
ncbi:uncharacterized protein TrAtP1_012527 [Trichoderma atroviride]|uniref:uncharacterized protein n=1 Tax=Hypocrea atroviridis TaxID=63577 RepID=UPI0033188691|nr:hypothetical protein TrAtP1_012527 [Trichoderma atroviride]